MPNWSVPHVWLINLSCCWLGMVILPLLVLPLMPTAFLSTCGTASVSLDMMILVSLGGMIAGAILATMIAYRGRLDCLAAHACAIAAMIVVHPVMGAEMPFLPWPRAAFELALGMTPAMMIGFGGFAFLFLVPRMMRSTLECAPAPGRGQR